MKLINKNISGVRGYKYVVLEKAERKGFWKCRCDCGKEFICSVYNILSGRRKACSSSCGRTQHGHAVAKSKPQTYTAWTSMRQRCYNQLHKAYPSYGGRGIKICERWIHSYTNFLTDMGEPTALGLTLERKDNNGDYTPDNCIWATTKEQNRNQRTRAWLDINGERKPVWQWAEETNQPASTIYSRMRKGWTGQEVLYGRTRKPKRGRVPNMVRRQRILTAIASEWRPRREIVTITGINREDARRELMFMLVEGLVETKIEKTGNVRHKLWRCVR